MNCILCNNPKFELYETGPLNQMVTLKCAKCGNYILSDLVYKSLKEDSSFLEKKAQVASFIRSRKIYKENPIPITHKKNEIINSITIDEILNIFPRNINDKIDLTILNLSKMTTFMGQFINFDKYDYPVFYCDNNNKESYGFMINTLSIMDFIEFEHRNTTIPFDNLIDMGLSLRISPAGWNKIYNITASNAFKSKNAFIAMSFNPDLDIVYKDGIEKAVIDTGYNPIRVDKAEHNEKICDRIIMEIRRSKFIISDFTEHKNGVYFEAGFGLGLGIPVIWTCREDQLDSAHFDTRQYNHIAWSTEDELYLKLKNRIIATII